MGARGMRVGDVVRLKSGGPDMTVESLRGGGLVDCVWFHEGGAARGHFLAPTLDTVTRAKPEAGGRADRSEGESEGEAAKARLLRKPRKGVH